MSNNTNQTNLNAFDDPELLNLLREGVIPFNYKDQIEESSLSTKGTSVYIDLKTGEIYIISYGDHTMTEILETEETSYGSTISDNKKVKPIFWIGSDIVDVTKEDFIKIRLMRSMPTTDAHGSRRGL